MELLTNLSWPNNKNITEVTSPQRPVGEDDAEVEVVGGVGAVRGHAPVDDGRVGAARGVEQQPVLQGLLQVTLQLMNVISSHTFDGESLC